MLYVLLFIRLDIVFVVNTLEKYVLNSNLKYISAIKKIFKYLKKILNYGIKYYKHFQDFEYLIKYSDSDFIEEKTEYKFTSNYIYYLTNEFIFYQSKL